MANLKRIKYLDIPVYLSPEFKMWISENFTTESGEIYLELEELKENWENEDYFNPEDEEEKRLRAEHNEEYKVLCKYIKRLKYKELSATYY